MGFADFFRGKKILVTGAAGSIGGELVRQLIGYSPAAIRLLDINESALFEMENELSQHTGKLRFLIGDVRDRKRIGMAADGVDIVFHAAALKHVPLCEKNPFEAVNTNILGTQNVIDACLEMDVGRMVFISTDKAVNPINVMGASKLLAERLVIAAENYKGLHNTRFSVVRFGNVLGSRGSILPLLIDQIRKGGPVTITDRRMVRFIMPVSDAIGLVLKACAASEGGETFILRMPRVKVSDLIEAAIEKYAPAYGHNPSGIELKTIGSKPGEKLEEELVTEYESVSMHGEDGLFSITRDAKEGKAAPSSPEGPLLGKEEIMKILGRMDHEKMRLS